MISDSLPLSNGKRRTFKKEPELLASSLLVSMIWILTEIAQPLRSEFFRKH